MKLVFLAFAFLVVGGHGAGQQGGKTFERHTAEFRYLITSDDVGGYDSPGRTVVVLLDGSAFSEETLKKLFGLIARRFPEPERLEVVVNTSLW